jgi:hypothetical protein
VEVNHNSYSGGSAPLDNRNCQPIITSEENMDEPAVTRLYANFEYSLTGSQQSGLQMFLRTLPESCMESEEWKLLHALTYTTDWTPEPKFTSFPQKAGGLMEELVQKFVAQRNGSESSQ